MSNRNHEHDHDCGHDHSDRETRIAHAMIDAAEVHPDLDAATDNAVAVFITDEAIGLSSAGSAGAGPMGYMLLRAAHMLFEDAGIATQWDVKQVVVDSEGVEERKMDF